MRHKKKKKNKKNDGKPATDRPNLSYHIRYWDGDSYRYPIHWNGTIVNRKAKGIMRDDTNRPALRNEIISHKWENLAKGYLKILRILIYDWQINYNIDKSHRPFYIIMRV